MGKYFGKKCFLSFLIPSLRVCVATFEGEHFFGAWLRLRTFYFGAIAMIVAFCGHSQYTPSVEDEEKLLSLLEELVGDAHAELYLGGYGAFDRFALACGKRYQKTHPYTKLILVTPHLSLSYQKTHLACEKDNYDAIVYPELEHVPPKFAISHRNRWMVERADCVIAWLDHTWGGAFQTYKHAKRKKKILFNLSGKDI